LEGSRIKAVRHLGEPFESFSLWQKEHYNVITPKLIFYQVCDDYIIELSKSARLFLDLYQFGVSLIERIGNGIYRE
jgi:hypothetical protein